MTNIIYRRISCRGCDGHDLDLMLNLKPTPIGDAYVTGDKIDLIQPKYPIELYMCKTCGLAQLLDVIDPDVLYGDYIYQTSSSSGLLSHFETYADNVSRRCNLRADSLVVDIGSNDGTLLRCFQQRGMTVVGVEPASHIATVVSAQGIPSINDYFSPTLAQKIVNEYGNANLITANNVFANIDDLMSWVTGVDILLADDGVFVFESYYLLDLIENTVFDFIYHEHLSSFSVRPVQALFQRVGLCLIAVERVATKGGSLRYYVQRSNGPLKSDGTVNEMLMLEEDFGLYRKETFLKFSEKINRLKEKLLAFLSEAKRNGKSVVGFGASITCTTLIYHFEIGEYLEYLVDDNIAKQGRFSPGHHLPVLPAAAIGERKPDYVIILAWRFSSIIVEKYKDYLDGGGEFIVPLPEFKICEN
jgi:hypothetical protein